MEEQDRMQNTIMYSQFRDLLKNGAIESLTDTLWKFYSLVALPDNIAEGIYSDKQSIGRWIKASKALVTILGDLRNEEVHWRNQVYTDLMVPIRIEIDIQERLLSFSDILVVNLCSLEGTSIDAQEIIRGAWNSAMSAMPRRGDIVFDKDGRFTEESFQAVRNGVEKCYEEYEHLFMITNDLLTLEFLKKIKKSNIALNNKVYREVYKCLDFFGWIPTEIKEDHTKYTTRYVKENYIKAKFHRIKNDDSQLEELICDLIDYSLIDPRK